MSERWDDEESELEVEAEDGELDLDDLDLDALDDDAAEDDEDDEL